MLSSLSSVGHLSAIADDLTCKPKTAPAAPSELSQLLVRLADGDRRAFRELYDKTSSRMLGAALRIMGDNALAEDAVQEAYLRVWRSAARFDPERGEAMSWMGRIVRNVCFDRLPKDRDMARIEDIEIPVMPADPPDARLHACLKQLPENQSRALILMYVHGMTHPELAAYMNAPLGTVKSWINRGSHTLRTMMGSPE
jgi:RNA polymerase sigma-70 factor, ECF subfamily